MHRYCQAVQVLPASVRRWALELKPEQMARAEEVRLRVGRRPTVVLPEGERELSEGCEVERQELEQLVESAGRWSMHTVLDHLCHGFVPLEGGHRLGVCGTVVMEGERVRTMRDFSGVSLRIARQHMGIGLPLLPDLQQEAGVYSTLIMAPPGAGKTTLLRDLIRGLSDAENGPRVGVVDERGEIAAVWQGVPQMELGRRTDVLTGCPKAMGLEMMLRGMSVQVLAVDEITAERDVEAVLHATGCGVSVLATAHGSGRGDLHRRGLYQELLRQGIFRRLVTIQVCQGERIFRVEELT